MTHENYWKLQGTIKKLRKKSNKCFICGSTEEIVPHHIRQVKQETDDYFDENNLVLLCDYHHRRYHRQYHNVNAKTFCEFLRENILNPIKINKSQGDDVNFRLDKELKISKLKRIIKLLNKTRTKVVKISVNGKLYDISKVIEDNGTIIFELGEF